jgi:hypothetical protein
MKLILKIFALPVILVLKLFTLIVNVLVNLSAYVLSPLVLLISGILIYSLVKQNWFDVALAASMDAAIFLAVFAAGWITCMAEDVCSGLTAFLRS